MNEEPPLVCDASVVLNLGLRENLTPLVQRIRATRPLAVTEQVAGEVFLDHRSFYGAFLAEHFQIVEGPLTRLQEVEQASLPHGLDAGETSVLALCRERHWTPAIDERLGRTVALTLGIIPVGTIGLLKLALSESWMTDEQCMDAIRLMKQNGFYCPKVLANDDFGEDFNRLK
jgi:predicted nucleic acid-binding protein